MCTQRPSSREDVSDAAGAQARAIRPGPRHDSGVRRPASTGHRLSTSRRWARTAATCRGRLTRWPRSTCPGHCAESGGWPICRSGNSPTAAVSPSPRSPRPRADDGTYPLVISLGRPLLPASGWHFSTATVTRSAPWHPTESATSAAAGSPPTSTRCKLTSGGGATNTASIAHGLPSPSTGTGKAVTPCAGAAARRTTTTCPTPVSCRMCGDGPTSPGTPGHSPETSAHSTRESTAPARRIATNSTTDRGSRSTRRDARATATLPEALLP